MDAIVTPTGLQELFETGRFSLAVGLSILSICLLLGWLLLRQLGESPVSQIVKESFLILAGLRSGSHPTSFFMSGLRLPAAGSFSAGFLQRMLFSMAISLVSPFSEGEERCRRHANSNPAS